MSHCHQKNHKCQLCLEKDRKIKQLEEEEKNLKMQLLELDIKEYLLSCINDNKINTLQAIKIKSV